MILRTNTLLLAGLLTLSACTTSPTPPTQVQPQPNVSTPRALGVYEMSISGDGKVAQHASIRAQANEAGGLSFETLEYGYTVDNAAGASVAYATFKVTNGSTADLTAPVLVPIDTAGPSGTTGYTPFRALKTFSGADASAKAALLAYTTTTDREGRRSALAENLDSGVITGIDTGRDQLAGTARTGWTIPALPAGQSSTVTVAFRIPGTDTQTNPYSFNMVFTVADNVPQTSTLTNIGTVQGSTPSGDAASPLVGQSVTLEGVVTSVAPGLSGYFLQEEGIDADSSSDTADGLFVFCGSTCPALTAGVRVRVTGTVAEFRRSYTFNATSTSPAETVTAPFTTTQLTGTTTTVLMSGLAAPETIAITPDLPVAARERLEGMLVTTSGVVTNNFPLGRFGSLDLAAERIPNFTQINAPSTTAYAAFTSTFNDRFIRVDDSSLGQNPASVFGRGGQPLSASNTLRGGDTGTVTGVLHYDHDGFGNRSGSNFFYRIQATQATFNPTNPRIAAPEEIGGTLRVGSMNVLNYFTSLVSSNTGCTPNGTDSGARGANNCEEFLRQQSKIVKAILGLNSDVLGLLEIQNDFDKGANSSVANLVNALNAEVGAGTYAYINPGAKVGTDAISVAMIYKTAAVDPVGNLAILDNTVNANYTDTCNRPTWAQTFQSKANGGRVTAVMLHLKSKGSACNTLGDADTDDGQGNGYIARRNAATALVNWLNTNPTGVTEDDRILMGDYNAYAMEEPLTILANGGYTNLFDKNVYSYQFDGQWGSLDQATGSASLLGQVAGKTKWHINADEPTVLDYNTEFKSAAQKTSFYAADPFRSSDHDPILVGLTLTAQTPLPVGVPAAAIGLNPTSSAVSVTAGQSTTNTVNVTRTSYTGDVTLTTSVAPKGTGTGTLPFVTVTTQPGAGNAGTVNVDATGATAGAYTVTVTGSGAGVSDATAFDVNVTPAALAGTPWINEFSYDTAATNDTGGEYVEVIVPAGVNISTLSLVLYNGNGGASYRTDAFIGNTNVTSTALNNGYTAYLFTYPATTSGLFQNGAPDGMALCNSSQVVQFLSYEGTFSATNGCASGITSTDVSVSQTNAADGTSLQLSGTGNKYADFTWNTSAPSTRGAVNTGQTLN